MKIGEKIRQLREQKNYSMDDLGKLIGTRRQTIMKYEKGIVENIPRKTIEKLARVLGVTPCELMCFEDYYDENQLAMEVKVIEAVQGAFGKDAVLILQYFMELNDDGKQQALKNVSDLTEIPKYQVQFKVE
jgi:transcriptional regulator with XRE-family HTH domain